MMKQEMMKQEMMKQEMMKQKMNFAQISRTVLLLALVFWACFAAVQAQTTAFTYQGRFTDSTVAQPTNGTYNMQFRLFDTDGTQSAGTQSGTMQSALVSVVNGIFTVKLDFGAAVFATTQPRFLEIQVGATVLTPRQEITSAPFSNRALSAANADALSSACVSCVTNAQINSIDGGKVTGTVANATNATNTTNFSGTLSGNVTGTQNATVVSNVGGQTAANINTAVTAVGNATNLNNANAIVRRDSSGNFIAGTITATSFNGNATSATLASTVSGATNLNNANTIVQRDASGSFFAGTISASNFSGAGATNLNTANTVVKRDASGGFFAGEINGVIVNAQTQFNLGGNRVFTATAGAANNTFIGFQSGAANPTGTKNVFVGEGSGFTNSSGSNNSFFGLSAGRKNTTGVSNSFFGLETGFDNMEGSNNSFFGRHAGLANKTGNENVFLGVNAGLSSLSGNQNVFLGVQAGNSNTVGSSNTIIGTAANVAANNLTFATALGAGAVVADNNSVVLGRTADTVKIPGNLNVVSDITTNGNLKFGTTGNLFAVGSEENLRVVRGLIQVGSGGTLTILAGSGFTVTRNGVGDYTIVFTTAFTDLPVVTPSIFAPEFVYPSNLNAGSATIRVRTPNQTPSDPPFFQFIAVGPR